jgi:hypothetical protein
MSAQAARQGFKQTSIDAVVIRADGTRVDLGTIAYYHRNPLRRWAWSLGKFGRRMAQRAGSLFH